MHIYSPEPLNLQRRTNNFQLTMEKTRRSGTIWI
jgi:hypothetical protein